MHICRNNPGHVSRNFQTWHSPRMSF
jgi:hypothetical protein